MNRKAFTLSRCLECRNYQKNCCSDAPRVPLTIKDIRKIESMGFKQNDFVIAGKYSTKKVKGEEKWWRESMIVVSKKSFKINTKKTKNGKCVFLKDGTGCILGKDRPFVCKIYPFWIDNKGRIDWEPGEKEYCYMGKNGLSLEEAIKAIKETPITIKKYFNEIRKDCIDNKPKYKKILLNCITKL